QVAVGRCDQEAPPRRAPVMHARDDLLADIASLPQADAAHLVEQGVMRECAAEREVVAAFGNSLSNAERMPCVGTCVGGYTCTVAAQGRMGRGETPIAQASGERG